MKAVDSRLRGNDTNLCGNDAGLHTSLDNLLHDTCWLSTENRGLVRCERRASAHHLEPVYMMPADVVELDLGPGCLPEGIGIDHDRKIAVFDTRQKQSLQPCPINAWFASGLVSGYGEGVKPGA